MSTGPAAGLGGASVARAKIILDSIMGGIAHSIRSHPVFVRAILCVPVGAALSVGVAWGLVRFARLDHKIDFNLLSADGLRSRSRESDGLGGHRWELARLIEADPAFPIVNAASFPSWVILPDADRPAARTEAWGLPFQCLRLHLLFDAVNNLPVNMARPIGEIWYPVKPIWLGLVGNTAIYGSIIFLSWIGAVQLRARRQWRRESRV